MTHRGMRKILGSVAAACALLVAGIALPSVAVAHSALVSTSPPNDAVLDAAPREVSFTFNEDLLDGADTLSINDSTGTNVASLQAKPNGPTVSIPWPAGLASGVYQVAYRVVSADGHPVQGAISFTLAADSVAASNSPAAGTSSSVSAVPISGSASAVPSNETASAAPVNNESGSTGNPWPGLIIGIAIGIAIVVVFGLVQRRRRR